MKIQNLVYKMLPLCVSLATAAAAQAQSIAELAVTKYPLNVADLADYQRYITPELLSCDPPLNSVRTAHGNTDWHIDTAHEFLFGTEMDGSASAANHTARARQKSPEER